MFHSMFYYGVTGSAPTTYPFRPGDFTVEGGQSWLIEDFASTTPNATQYLLDANSQTALTNCDFVLVMANPMLNDSYNNGTPETLGTGGANGGTMCLDFRGDGGGTTMVANGTANTTVKTARWSIQCSQDFLDPMYDDDLGGSVYNGALVVPKHLIGTSDSSMTGLAEWRGNTVSEGLLTMIFCSWNTNAASPKMGDYTVLAHYYRTQTTGESGYLMPSAFRNELANADFLLVMVGGNTQARNFARMDFQGDAGSNALATVGNTNATTNSKNVVWSIGANPLYIPKSLMGASDGVRTSRILSATNSALVTILACQWN